MKNRVAAAKRRTGFGLVAWLEQTKIDLPLKGVECRFQVCGELLNVEIDQIFHQNSRAPLDCLYTFPLPAGAAVYRCELHVQGRVVAAKVEERERARQIASEQKAAGRRTALVEMERDNLFTLSLGNVQPDEVVVIRFGYFQTLARLADWVSFAIPFCPGVRYIPGQPLLRAPRGRGLADDTDEVPDASRISPPRLEVLSPDAAYLSVEGTVEDPLGVVRDISSSSHPVLVRDGRESFGVSLAHQANVPDCDFALRWTEVAREDVDPIGWVLREKSASYALVSLSAPKQVEVASNLEQDVYFLLDRSGSMAGLKWEKTAQAFREFVKTLGPADRVWATFFETGFRDLAEKPLSTQELLRDPAVRRLEYLGTQGGTELWPALEHVLKKVAEHSAERPASVLLITDGQVGNEARILERLRAHPALRVHVFGIDTAVNDGFLKKLAAQQRGTAWLVTPDEDIVGTVKRLGERLRRPVLTSLTVDAGWELAEGAPPDLHAGENLALSLKSGATLKEIVLRGQLPGGEEKVFRFQLEEKALPALRCLWARRRIEDHLAQGQSAQAIALAKEHNLICAGAAFVAWDEAEKVMVSQREVYQPAMAQRMAAGKGVRSRFAMRAFAAADTYGDLLAKTMDAPEQSAPLSLDARDLSSPAIELATALEQFFRQRYSGSERSSGPWVSRLCAWHDAMLETGALLDRRLGWEAVLRPLCEWALADDWSARADKLYALLAELKPFSANARAAVRHLRAWVERELKDEPEYRERLNERLGALEARLGLAQEV